jgi:hypothetical protein
MENRPDKNVEILWVKKHNISPILMFPVGFANVGKINLISVIILYF